MLKHDISQLENDDCVESILNFWFERKYNLSQWKQFKIFNHDSQNVQTPRKNKNRNSLRQNILIYQTLVSLPSEIGVLTNLVELYLKRLYIQIIPPSIQNLKNLRVLDLSMNDIEVLPDELYQLSDLQELTLNNNLLQTISPNIKNMANLSILSLSNNNLIEIPAEIGELLDLSELYIDGNFIQTLPSSLVYLHLEILDIRNNPYLNIQNWSVFTNFNGALFC